MESREATYDDIKYILVMFSSDSIVKSFHWTKKQMITCLKEYINDKEATIYLNKTGQPEGFSLG